MASTILARLRAVADGFWLLPGSLAVAFVVLAEGLVAIDRRLGEDTLGFTFDGDASAARGVLETVAGSIITVAGVTFSLTIVVLSLVSGQFTPRSVPAFLADRINQTTAGAFIGVFTYCLLVLRTVRDPEDGGSEGFVPQLSVTVAVGLGVLAIALLLFFIHHLGVSIQASSIVTRVARQTLDRIRQLPEEGAELPDEPAGEPAVVRPAAPGFVRHVALDRLDDLDECEHVRLRVAPGDFVTEADALAHVWPAGSAEDAASTIRGAISLGHERDLHQDPLYGIRQLAEIAMKALSPGVNDPSTAESAIGYLRAALEELAVRPLPPAVVREQVAAPLRGFDDYVEGAFTQVALYAAADATVAVTLLNALARIAARAQERGFGDRVEVLARAANRAAEQALERARTDEERGRIRDALARVG